MGEVISDQELRQCLLEFNEVIPPITNTTRKVLLKKLANLKSGKMDKNAASKVMSPSKSKNPTDNTNKSTMDFIPLDNNKQSQSIEFNVNSPRKSAHDLFDVSDSDNDAVYDEDSDQLAKCVTCKEPIDEFSNQFIQYLEDNFGDIEEGQVFLTYCKRNRSSVFKCMTCQPINWQIINSENINDVRHQTRRKTLKHFSKNKSELTNKALSGRRIVDINYLISQVQTRHDGEFNCSFLDMVYQSESIFGNQTSMIFKCTKCKTETTLNFEKYNETVVNDCQTSEHTEIPEITTSLEMLSLSAEDIEIKKREFLSKLENVNFKKIEVDTREQSDSKIWYQERRIRLTASTFGQICKMRNTTSCKNYVYNKLYSTNLLVKSVQYGKKMEIFARKKTEEKMRFSVQNCGLFIDTEFPYLAASPDGLVGKDSVIEIKCPYSAKNTTNEIDAVNKKLLNYCVIDGNGIKLKTNHNYYYQIMGQMRITKRNKCYFVIYTPNWISVEEIRYNETFWENNMIEKLKKFYMKCLLPEIINPRYSIRSLKSDIVDPDYILEEQEKKTQNTCVSSALQ